MTDRDAATASDQIRVRPFADFLQEHAEGTTHGDLSEALHQLVEAVQAHCKAGSLGLTVKIKPMSNSDPSTLVVTCDIVLKAPEADPASKVFFVDKDGNLSRDDPRQLHLPLREVPAPRTYQPEEHHA